jgi:hypothetical protein
MNPITVTGRLGDDPRAFTTRDGTAGVELRLAVEIPSRSDQNITRWIKVVAFGLLASRTAASVGKGDRVTVIADDLKGIEPPFRPPANCHWQLSIASASLVQSSTLRT